MKNINKKENACSCGCSGHHHHHTEECRSTVSAECTCATGETCEKCEKKDGKKDKGDKSSEDGDEHSKPPQKSRHENCCEEKKHKNNRHNHAPACEFDNISHKHGKNENGTCGCGGNHGTGKKNEIILSSVLLAISFAFLAVSFFNPFAGHKILRYLDFGWVTVFICGTPIILAAVRSLAAKKLTANFLITVSVFACLALQILVYTNVLGGDGHDHSYIFAAGEVVWLMAVGEFIEMLTVKKARSGVERLVNLVPQTARLSISNEVIPVSNLKIGDTISVRPFEQIPADGIVKSGVSTADTSVITGEQLAVDLGVGSKVYGGTINGSGVIEVEVNSSPDKMTITRLKELTEQAAGSKAPISRLADKFAGVIVPLAIALSVIIFCVHFFFVSRFDASNAVYMAVTVLVVFCPCALTLATPTAVAAAIGNLSKRGVLVKNAAAIERMAKADIFAFDKTGTITTAKMRVELFNVIKGEPERVKMLTGIAESTSDHPIAKAIAEFAKIDGKTEAQEVKVLAGSGIQCKVQGERIQVVSANSALANFALTQSEKKEIEAAQSGGLTVSVVFIDDKVSAVVGLSGEIKKGAAEAIAALKEGGNKCVMLTGDNMSSAAHIASQVGIDSVRAQLLPQDKPAAVQEFQKAGGIVCMVGDGVNDAPALATADVSIAMGALGSDAAIDAADCALLGDDLKKLPGMKGLCSVALKVIKSNIIISLSISVLGILLSFLGLLNPASGALVHNAASVIVVVSSAMLLTVKEKKSGKEKKQKASD